jgi:hypothetical protein
MPSEQLDEKRFALHIKQFERIRGRFYTQIDCGNQQIFQEIDLAGGASDL